MVKFKIFQCSDVDFKLIKLVSFLIVSIFYLVSLDDLCGLYELQSSCQNNGSCVLESSRPTCKLVSISNQ